MSTKVFEVCLRGGAPWGFRLTGGKEFRTSLRVSKVEANGKAEAEGIAVNDEIVAINGSDVQNSFHTEALAFVKKAGNELLLVLNRATSGKRGEDVSVNEPENYEAAHNQSQKMIEITAFQPSFTVPMKPASATSVPQKSVIHTENYAETYDSKDERYREWSPDIINDITRVPDQIVLQKHTDPEYNNPVEVGDDDLDQSYYKRTSSLPKSLGKRHVKSTDQYRSLTLPRKKPEESSRHSGAPAWYKEMYREINKSMEGQSNLSRLLSADAKKGAFRRYDGATSSVSLSPRGGRRQRPKSIHVDHFKIDDSGVQDLFVSKDDMNKQQNVVGTSHEKRQQRHSVHSAWYREFQRGGQIPSTGLSAALDSNQDMRQPVHFRSRSSDDILSSSSKGLPYQIPDDRSPDNRLSNPAKFEYNNPPDFLELRRKAEADGALRDDRERELKMIQEERRKWLKEEEELKSKREAARKHSEEMKQRQKLEEAMRIEQQQVLEQRELEKQGTLGVQMIEKSDHGFGTIQSGTTFLKGTALYSFTAQSPIEISFKKGQLLHIIRQIDENWYEGEVDSNIGIFPVNYVQICMEEVVVGGQSEQFAERIEIEDGLARAKYSFLAESDKELSFKKNEKIVLLRRLDENWYEGEISDRIGILPKNYLEILKEPVVLNKADYQVCKESVNGSSLQPLKDDQKGDQSFPSTGKFEVPDVHITEQNHAKGEKYRSLFSYLPMNNDEVELLENDIIRVLEKCDDGWFVGVCERTGKFGTFPGNYVVPY